MDWGDRVLRLIFKEAFKMECGSLPEFGEVRHSTCHWIVGFYAKKFYKDCDRQTPPNL